MIEMCERLRTNLERLNRKLDDFARASDIDLEARPTLFGRDVEDVAFRLPLLHATSRDNFLELYPANVLLSKTQRVALSESDEPPSPDSKPGPDEKLGTDGFVFTYVGAFGYPEQACGFVFSAAYEESRAGECVATPFDSGGLVNHLLRSWPLDEQRAFLSEHELPVPDYRNYLARTLRLLFRDPQNYLLLRDEDIPSPFRFEGGDYRRWLFEVRFAESIPLEGSLVAVVLPSALTKDDGVLQWVSRLRSREVRVVWYQSPHIKGDWSQLQRAGIECVAREAGTAAS